ncbi:MAG: exosortase [Acidobacteria bacterium]|nr:exosortase [Acidobacteriota bacterium]
MTLSAKALLGLAAVLGALALLYWRIGGELVHAWSNDGNYSHGFLIPPLALYFAWERRSRLTAAASRPSWLGMVLILGSVGVLLAGLLGSELFLSRVSFVGIVAGIVLFVFGWAHLRILAFPIAFLLLMIPIPALIFNQIAFPLQLLASQAGEVTMATAGIPVLREGNVLILANTSLEVAEACSGIRSLISLITLGLVFGYFADSRAWVRAAIVLSAIPVAIVSNAARVAGTGVAAHYYGVAAAEGFFHEFSGWVVFVLAFLLILAIQQVILRLAPLRSPSVA